VCVTHGHNCRQFGADRKAAAATTLQNPPLTVMSYNIRYDNPRDGPDAWFNRKGDMVSFLRSPQSAPPSSWRLRLRSPRTISATGSPARARIGCARNADLFHRLPLL
jgi:hypothetical protein